MERKNDWIAALINRPDFTMVDMYANDIKPENTGLQDKDYYKEIPQVREKFKTDNGQFDEQAYGEFYDSALRMYNAYTDGDFLDKMLNNIERSPFDWTKIDNPNVQDVSAVLSASHDPYRHSMGLRNLYDIGDPQFSLKEVAQANFVRDENGNKLDWTPNDKGGLIKDLFRPTVVLAQYEEDTTETDPYGNTIFHKAGDYKFDENGNPYYELLGNRNSYGKQVLNYSDTFTVEGTVLNKFDPFDSDGINKSIGSTLAKTTLKLAPFLFGPTVGAVAGTAYALFGLASVMPVLGKMVNGIVSSNDTDFGKGLTKWESYMERFAPAKSESGSNSFWNFENIADIIASSASQLYSQRQIANIPKWLSKGKETMRNSKIGQQIALGYMATTSAQDTYSSYIEAGANEELAGIASLATMGAFYGLMSQDYWKSHMFGGSWLDENATMYRRTMQEWSKEQAAKLNALNPNPAPAKWYKSVYDKVTDFLKNNKTLNSAKSKAASLVKKSGETTEQATTQTAKQANKSFLSSASDYLRTGLNEGIEETMEEATTDLIKGLSMGLEALGVDVTKDEGKLDFGFSAQDFLSRYTSAFIGGTIGGMVFEGLKKKDNRFGPKTVSILDKDTKERLIWLELNGYGDKMKQWVEKEYRKGNLGNENLSSEKVDQTLKNSPFKPGTKEDNQNLLMRNVLLQTLDEIEYNINNFVGTLVYSDLYKAAVEESEKRAKEAGLSIEEYTQKEKVSPLVNTLLGMGVADNIMDDFVDITNRIVDLNEKITIAENEEASKTIDSDPNHSTSNKYIRNLIKQRDDLIKKAEDIKNGKNLDQYLEQVFFYVSPELANFYIHPKFGDESKPETSYIHTDITAYTKWRYGLDYNSLSDTIQKQLKDEFREYKEADKRGIKVRLAQRIHSTLSKEFKPQLEALNTELQGYKKNPFFGATTFGEFAETSIEDILKNNKIIQQKLKKIEIENPDYLMDADWTALNTELEVNKTRLSNYETIKNGALSRLRLDRYIPQALSSEELQDASVLQNIDEQSNDLFNRQNDDSNPISNEERLALINSIKDYYQYLVNNKIVNSGEDPFNNTIGIAFSGVKNGINNLKNLNTQEATANFFQNLDPDNLEVLRPLWELDEYKQEETFEEEIENNPSYFPTDIDEIIAKLSDDQIAQIFGDDALLVEYVKADNKDTTRLGKIISKLDSLATTLQNNLFDFTRQYEEIKTQLPSIGISEQQLQDLILKYLFGGNQQLLDSTLDLINTRNASKLSTAYDLIKNIELQINGQNSALWDVLQREEKSLYTKKSLKDYITDNFSKDSLRYGLQVVNLLIPQVSAAVNGGFNSHLNEEKAKLGKELLPIIENNSAEIILDDLEHIASKLRFLLHLADQNQDSQWREQQEAAIHMDPKYISDLLKYSDQILTYTDGKLNLKEIWDKANVDTAVSLAEITEQNYEKFEKAKRAFEIEVYKNVNLDEKSRALFKNAIVQLLDASSILKLSNSEYSRSLEKDLKPADIARYLMAIGFTNTEHFLSIYKTAISDKNQYVPFSGQEFIIRQMYSQLLNQNDYRDIINEVGNKFKAKADELKDRYLKDKSILDSFLFVDGNSAVGKSSAISYTFRRMLEIEFGNKVQFKGVARFGDRKQNLIDNLHLTEGDFKYLDDLIKELWPSQNIPFDVNDENLFDTGLSTKGKIENEHRLKIKGDFVLNEDKFFNGGDYKVLVFDEVTLANEAELQILNKWARDNGILIIGLGNLKQNAWQTRVKAYSEKGDTYTASNSCIEDCLVWSTPILKASLRTQNEGKRRNKDTIEAVITSLLDQSDAKPELSLEDLKYDNHQIDLLYYQDTVDGKTEYYGEHFVTDDSILKDLQKKAEEGAKVLIVADDPNKYSAYQSINPNIKVLDPNSAQGSEADYVFVDHDFSSRKTIGGKENPLLFFRDFYTMITRSKQATFIKIDGQDILNKWNIKEHNEEIAKSKIQSVIENKEILDKFRAWRLKFLEDIPEFTPVSNESSSTESGSSTETPTGSLNGATVTGHIIMPTTVPILTRKSDRQHWEDAIEQGTIYNDNTRDFQKRQRIKNDDITALDIDEFINLVNDTDQYDKYNFLTKIDPDFTLEQYKSFISYLSLGVSRYLYDRKIDKNAQFNFKYITRYISGISGTSLNTLIEAINNSVNTDTPFILNSNGEFSNLFIPISIEGKNYVIPIARINTQLNGFVSKDYLVVNPDNSVQSIAVSSSGNTFMSLTEAAKNKAFVLNGAVLFKPSRELACDINNGYFKRNNAGTSSKMILDTPIENDDDEIKGRFQLKIDKNLVTSFVDTKDARLIRANVRAKDFQVFWDLVKAKIVYERGYVFEDMDEAKAQEILQTQYGDILNELQFVKSADKNLNAGNAGENNQVRRSDYRILNERSLDSVTSAILYWANLYKTGGSDESKDVLATWNQILLDYANSDISPNETDSGYRYQNALFFGFRNANGTYTKYVLRRKIGEGFENTFELTTDNASNDPLLTFTDDSLVDLNPEQFFELFLSKLKEANQNITTYSGDSGNIVEINPKELGDRLNDRSVVFGLYRRGIKEDPETGQISDNYYSPFDTDLIQIFRDPENGKMLNDALKSFSEIANRFNPFKFGLFLNVGANNNNVIPQNQNIEQPWYRINVSQDDKFVTDIVEVIAPLYGIHIEPNALSKASNKTEAELWGLVTGEKVELSSTMTSEEIGLNENLRFNTTTAKFKDQDEQNLNYLGKANKGSYYEYYLSDDHGLVQIFNVSTENNSKIEQKLNKSYSRQNFVAYSVDREIGNAVIYEEDGEYYYYESSNKFTIDPGTTGVKVNIINWNGKNKVISSTGEEIRDMKVITSINDEIKSDKETYFYKTSSGIKFNTPLSVSKSFLEKYTSTPLNNISSEYIMIDSISNDIINTSDGNQIVIKNPKDFLDELINWGIKENPKVLVNKISAFIQDNRILKEIDNLSKNIDLDQINRFLEDNKYEIGVKLTVDSDLNIIDQITPDIIANYLARQILSLKNQIKSVSLENNDGVNKRVRITLNDNSIKTYQFKTEDFNFKDSQYYKSQWNYQEVNNTEDSESYTNDTFEQLSRELNDDVLFKVGDAQDVRTYLNLLITNPSEAKLYRKRVKDLMLKYRNGTPEEQIIYQKYDEYMSRIGKIIASNNKKC